MHGNEKRNRIKDALQSVDSAGESAPGEDKRDDEYLFDCRSEAAADHEAGPDEMNDHDWEDSADDASPDTAARIDDEIPF